VARESALNKNGAWRAAEPGKAMMIWLTRLNQSPFVLNAEQISHLEVTPDTVIFLTDGQKIVVRETAQAVIDRVIEYKRSTLHASPTLQTNG
jgi:flagellar protein FlbD